MRAVWVHGQNTPQGGNASQQASNKKNTKNFKS
jgi:hypothetical protein